MNDLGGLIPGKVGLGCIKTGAEQTKENKAVSSAPLWPLLWFLNTGPALSYSALISLNNGMWLKGTTNLFLHKLLSYFIIATRTKIGRQYNFNYILKDIPLILIWYNSVNNVKFVYKQTNGNSKYNEFYYQMLYKKIC